MSSDTTNIIWGPVENLRTLIASSASFRTLVGAADAAAAKAHIYCPSIPAESVLSARPFAMIDQGSAWQVNRISEIASRYSGSLFMLLEADVNTTTYPTDEAAAKWFYKLAGDIINEMLALAGADGQLNVTDVTVRDGPSRISKVDQQEMGDFFQVVFELTWGP